MVNTATFIDGDLFKTHGEPLSDAVHRAASVLDLEERELWRQLRRKRDFEGRVAGKRAQLAELQEKRRIANNAHTEVLASVEHLRNEINFSVQQERELEHDLAVLSESNRLLQRNSQLDSALSPQDLMEREKIERKSAQAQHEQISDYRANLERIRIEKRVLQEKQQELFDKQRAAEQDRNRLIGTLQDDRSGINELRAQRIRLWEEQTIIQREMSQIVLDVQHKLASGEDPPGKLSPALPSRQLLSSADAPDRLSVPGAAGGVRGHVSRDTPLAFAETPVGVGDSLASSDGDRARPHWTSFSEDAAGKTFGVGTGFEDSSFADGALPPFGTRDRLGNTGLAMDATGEAEVTDWSAKMRSFKEQG
mmetsp:Transcript_104737/g.208097  ORF Transcript_104737/g.208097 Transcript_104737/m.208097 type:complete len:365 (-) Transcript_104737:214-1308(-)|eukprot:CAMPEP_0172727114 /NCGR_PEP_ID=MMETSP1074-20121228/91494_1 /TAXON_ID=2916 /ORGANISM="Ceratium fusus, Strain PA161109" /LENGTH=364 /DNA_ID=CAMNT_0013554229 /DNA_START=93 /DNA_END=1187 /DNA_ORIENTATION=+